ncbi:hypothetical protein [Paraburkholderia xenovorans]
MTDVTDVMATGNGGQRGMKNRCVEIMTMPAATRRAKRCAGADGRMPLQ